MGSYNFTASAEQSNDENLIVINNPDIAAEYIKEFERVYAVALTISLLLTIIDVEILDEFALGG